MKNSMRLSTNQLMSLALFGIVQTNLWSQISIQGGLHLKNAAFNIHSKDIHISQSDITGNGTVVLYATDDITITGSTTKIPNLTIASTKPVTIAQDFTVKDHLDMGVNNIVATTVLGVGENAAGTIDWKGTGSVVGKLRRWYNPTTNSSMESGIFPVGLASKNMYFRINYTEAPPAAGYVIAEYKVGIMPVSSAWTSALASDGLVLVNYENDGYWEITPYSASGVPYEALNESEYSLIMRANNLTTVIDRSETRILKSIGPDHDTYQAAGIHNLIDGTSDGDYTIESTGVVGYSYFNIASSDVNPLPVELLSFSGNCELDSKTISWSTASEHDSWYFQPQYSIDGITWINTQKIDAATNSNSLLSYSQRLNVSEDLVFVRLQQVDLNGEIEYYGPIQIACEENENELLVFPNPTKDYVNISFHSSATGNDMHLTVQDLSGKTLNDSYFDSHQGSNIQPLEFQYAPGVYMLNLYENNQLIGRKQVVVN